MSLDHNIYLAKENGMFCHVHRIGAAVVVRRPWSKLEVKCLARGHIGRFLNLTARVFERANGYRPNALTARLPVAQQKELFSDGRKMYHLAISFRILGSL